MKNKRNDNERVVVANRLLQVSENFDNDKDRYIFDLLELAAKKVEKKMRIASEPRRSIFIIFY